MNTHLNGSESAARRKIPNGLAIAIDGSILYLQNGTRIHIGTAMDPDSHLFDTVHELFSQIGVLRKLLKEACRQQGIEISDASQFYRGLASTAGKIQEHPEDLRAIAEPILRELFEDMLKPREPRKQHKGNRHGHSGNGGHHDQHRHRS